MSEERLRVFEDLKNAPLVTSAEILPKSGVSVACEVWVAGAATRVDVYAFAEKWLLTHDHKLVTNGHGYTLSSLVQPVGHTDDSRFLRLWHVVWFWAPA